MIGPAPFRVGNDQCGKIRRRTAIRVIRSSLGLNRREKRERLAVHNNAKRLKVDEDGIAGMRNAFVTSIIRVLHMSS